MGIIQKIRKFLIQLSGRLMEKGKDFTHPALLSGLENYLQMIDLLTKFTIDDLFEIKQELVNIMGIEI